MCRLRDTPKVINHWSSEVVDGVVIVAGQSHDSAHGFASDALALRASQEGVADPLPAHAPWMEHILAMDPSCVLFAHDHSVWRP